MRVLLIFLCMIGLALSYQQLDYLETMKAIQSDPFDTKAMLLISTVKYCYKCKKGIEIIEDFDADMSGYVNTYVLDCKDVQKQDPQFKQIQQCAPEYLDTLPALSFFKQKKQEDPYSLVDNNPEEIKYTGGLSKDSLINFVHDFITNDIPQIQSKKEFQEFLNNDYIDNKVVIFNVDDRAPLWFRMAATYYRFRLDFVTIDPDSNSIHKKYHLVQFPAVLVFQKNNHQEYSGPQDFESFRDFLKPFALEQKKQRVKGGISQNQQWNVLKVVTLEQLEREFQADQESWFLVQLKRKESQENHKQLNKIQNYYGQMFKYFQVICSTDACPEAETLKLNQDKLPGISIYGLSGKSFENRKMEVKQSDTLKMIADILVDTVNKYKLVIQDQNFLDYMHNSLYHEGLNPVIMYYESKNIHQELTFLSLAANPKYQQYFKFALFPNPGQNMIDNYHITKMPRVSFMKSFDRDTMQNSRWDFENEFNFNNLITYLNQATTLHNPETIQKSQVAERAYDGASFEKECSDLDDLCVIAILDSVKEGKVKQIIDKLSAYKKKYYEKKYKWLYIDGICQKDLLKQFGVTELNRIVLYKPSKQRFLTLNNTVENFEHSINIISSLKGWKKVSSLSIDDVNCDDIIDQARTKYRQERQQKQRQFVKNQRQTKKTKQAEEDDDDDYNRKEEEKKVNPEDEEIFDKEWAKINPHLKQDL